MRFLPDARGTSRPAQAAAGPDDGAGRVALIGLAVVAAVLVAGLRLVFR